MAKLRNRCNAITAFVPVATDPVQNDSDAATADGNTVLVCRVRSVPNGANSAGLQNTDARAPSTCCIHHVFQRNVRLWPGPGPGMVDAVRPIRGNSQKIVAPPQIVSGG